MTSLIILALIAGFAMILIAALANKGIRKRNGERHNNDKEHTPIKARSILTINEQPIFLKLRKALPDHIVLTQVALSALLSTTGQVTRNKFNRYRADFVVLDKDCKVLAIVELNDASHHQMQIGSITERDAMLAEANYRIIRYSHTPDIDQIQRDFITPAASKKIIKPAIPINQPPNKPSDGDSFFDNDY